MKRKLLCKLAWLECHLFKKDVFFLSSYRVTNIILEKFNRETSSVFGIVCLRCPHPRIVKLCRCKLNRCGWLALHSRRRCVVWRACQNSRFANTHVDSPLALMKHASLSAESKWRGVFFVCFFFPSPSPLLLLWTLK